MSSITMPLGSWAGDRLIAAALAGAAGLLLTIAHLTRRIARQADGLEEGLARTRDRTNVVFDVPKLTAAVEAITAEAKSARGGAAD